MSSNHTYIPQKLYVALTEELEQLRSGEGSSKAMDNAVSRARNTFEQIKKQSTQVNSQISRLRQQHLDNLHSIENSSAQLHSRNMGDLNQVSSSVQQLQGQIQDSIRDVNQISAQLANNYTTAEEMYRQVQIELSIAKSDPDYQRFAGQRMQNVKSSLQLIASREMNPLAKKAMLQSSMAELLLADSEVSAIRVQFHTTLHQALNLSSTMLANAVGHHNNNFVYGDEKHLASNMDYWTDGQYKLIEEELNEIRKRLEAAWERPDYSMQQLQADLDRLEELKKMQDLQAASVISQIKLSVLRHQQAEFIREVLSDDFYFQVIAEGFDHNDERDSYILRMQRPADNAIVEILVSPGKKDGEVDTTVRVDTEAYMDQKLLNTLEQAIIEDLQASGMTITELVPCNPEPIDINAPVEIDNNTSSRHNIHRRQHTVKP